MNLKEMPRLMLVRIRFPMLFLTADHFTAAECTLYETPTSDC
jgi:hypothetical protein